MRAAIRALLVSGVPEIGARWFEPHAVPAADTPRPFGVLRVGVQEPEDPWRNQATAVEVWPYAEASSYVSVDVLADQIVRTLHMARFASETGEPLLSEFAGDVTADGWDLQWQALTHPVRFRVYSLAWLGGTTLAPGDPVGALRAHVEALFPGELQTDPATWDPQDARPGCYFRLTTLDSPPFGFWLARRRYGFAGHVVAPDAAIRLQWLRRLGEALQAPGRRWCRMPDTPNGRPLELLRVLADTTRHPLREGQLRIDAEAFERRTPEPPPVEPVLSGPFLPALPPT